ncbi:MAG TPA: PQQ-dependent dehydrogenase, methanol/ethanol family [Gemmatimonadales bacterium]
MKGPLAAGRWLRTQIGIAVVLASLPGPPLPAQARPARTTESRAAPPGDWPSPSRDPQGTRFSPLAELTPANIGGLRVLWTFSTGSLRGHEGNPLVIGARLYLVTPHPNAVFAFDLERAGDPPLWRYDRPASRDPAPAACCDVSSRGLAWHSSGRLFVPLFTGEVVSLDAETGKEVWRTRIADPRVGVTLQAAPLVVGDLVVVGVAGGEFGARGYLSALDAATGKPVWRVWTTGPDSAVGISGPANVNYPTHQGRDLGVSTWAADSWRRGGGPTWGWLTYDPELDLLFHGSGAPGPLNHDQRRGDAKWTASLFARDPRTGTVKWAIQLTPGDRWGYGASSESIPTDLAIGGGGGEGGGGGAPRVRALVHFDANGFAYTIDRSTGRILLAEKYGPVNWAAKVDLGTGLPFPDPQYVPATGRKASGVCPSLLGMKGPGSAAYSPATGLFYVPASNLCMDIEPEAAAFEPGSPFLGAAIRVTPGPGGNRGRLIAWDAATGSIAWEIRETYPVLGGVLATAGGLVFYGTLDGWLKGVEAKSGRVLWTFRTPSGIVGAPITFTAPDGRQYLAVVSGVGGAAANVFNPPASRSPVARLGLAEAFGDLRRRTNPGGVLLIFGL